LLHGNQELADALLEELADERRLAVERLLSLEYVDIEVTRSIHAYVKAIDRLTQRLLANARRSQAVLDSRRRATG